MTPYPARFVAGDINCNGCFVLECVDSLWGRKAKTAIYTYISKKSANIASKLMRTGYTWSHQSSEGIIRSKCSLGPWFLDSITRKARAPDHENPNFLGSLVEKCLEPRFESTAQEPSGSSILFPGISQEPSKIQDNKISKLIWRSQSSPVCLTLQIF